MTRRNGTGPRQLQDMTEKFRKGEQRLLRTLEEEGLISAREREGLVQQVMSAASQKRASEVLTAAHTVHNKIIQVIRRGKVAGDVRERVELEVLYEIARLTQTTDDREKLFARLLDLVQQAIPYEHATLFLIKSDEKRLEVAARKGDVVDLIGGVKFDLGLGFSSWVAKQQKPILLADLHAGRRAGGTEVGSFLSVPLLVQAELIGVLNLCHSRPKTFTEDHLRMAILAAGQAAAVLQRFLMYQEMARLAITDDLTGLCNRRHFLQHLAQEVDRARRYGRPLALVTLDVDHFKRINDQHGHPVGDRVLADFGKLLQRSARSSDLAVRYGGEEFLVLMPDTDGDHAMMAAERLRAVIAEHTFPRRKKLTVSAGVAAFPEDVLSLIHI
ncbi:MAG: sensor domain-containing diguanylate cyclase [Candidatus Eisenbacteria bacterium]|nr:sensor domain-containing diguanylate cyclase [Candidatus Eisenbacteria bacterium]